MPRIFIVLLLLLSLQVQSNAQGSKFVEDFKQVKLHLANHKEELATPILENLLKKNRSNANIAYLLGYCYVKQEIHIDRAIGLLEVASQSYSADYDPTSLTEDDVSEYVYYYLIIAYSLNGQCEKAKNTLNKFYEVYSYYDEWYLIEGQKWLRECGQRQLAGAEDSTTVKEPAEILAADPVKTDQAAEMAEQKSKVFGDRLQLVDENFEVVDSSRGQASTARKKKNEGPEVVTKTIEYTTSTILHGVQIAAYLDPKFTRNFENVKNVDVYIDNNGVFRYVIGRFPYRQQAEKLLEYVRKAGYEDAFIVDINGDKYSEEVVTVDNESIKRQIKGKVDFRVQIGAFKKDIPAQIARQYLIVDEIKETRVGEYTVLTIGSFNSYEKAADFRNKIQTIGAEDAFIVAFNYDKKIPLDEAEAYLKQQRLEEIEDAAKDGKRSRLKNKSAEGLKDEKKEAEEMQK